MYGPYELQDGRKMKPNWNIDSKQFKHKIYWKELSYEQILKNIAQFTFQGTCSQESMWQYFMSGTVKSYTKVDS